MRAHSEAEQTPAVKRKLWVTRLSLLKDDKADYYFRMAYFHYMYQRASAEVDEAETALKAIPNEVD